MRAAHMGPRPVTWSGVNKCSRGVYPKSPGKMSPEGQGQPPGWTPVATLQAATHPYVTSSLTEYEQMSDLLQRKEIVYVAGELAPIQ